MRLEDDRVKRVALGDCGMVPPGEVSLQVYQVWETGFFYAQCIHVVCVDERDLRPRRRWHCGVVKDSG